MRRLCPLVALVAGCAPSGGGPPGQSVDPPVVVVTAPVEKEVTEYRDFTGRTDAVEFVDVRARVSGYLTKIDFDPGKEVEKDAVLFAIDDRPYQAALAKSKADILLADAKLAQAAADVKRNESLVRSGATTKADFDKLVADQKAAAAQKVANEAAANADQLNVDFCKVRSPIDGRISRNFITLGNLVAADATLLTTIVSQDPMNVYFDVDERTVLQIQAMIRAGTFKSARRHNDLHVAVGLATEGDRYPHEATVDYVDNRIGTGTGTLNCRAVLPNPVVSNDDRLFTAGLFVRVRLPLGKPHKALLVSDRAVGTDQGQKFVYLVNSKNEVVYAAVKLGPVQDGLRVVEEGLKPGDRVIVSGLQRVRPGVTVTPKDAAEVVREQ